MSGGLESNFSVYVDGRDEGITPVDTAVSALEHSVCVRQSGKPFRCQELDLRNLAPGTKRTVTFEAPAAAAEPDELYRVEFNSDPYAATIKIGNERVGNTNNVIYLPSGSHQLWVEKDGFIPRELPVDVPTQDPVEVVLGRPVTLTFVSDSDVQPVVKIDSVLRGHTPLVVDVSAEEHSFFIEADHSAIAFEWIDLRGLPEGSSRLITVSVDSGEVTIEEN